MWVQQGDGEFSFEPAQMALHILVLLVLSLNPCFAHARATTPLGYDLFPEGSLLHSCVRANLNVTSAGTPQHSTIKQPMKPALNPPLKPGTLWGGPETTPETGCLSAPHETAPETAP